MMEELYLRNLKFLQQWVKATKNLQKAKDGGLLLGTQDPESIKKQK